ncbi:NUDIX domain-containing protein [Mesorhizobium sp. B1-1-8]|uniref:NUDIX domain-containing protein n=1 Tax=Mesorhizobium sp. B1-1-8 TaxID=2589976 RepID=UPI0015E30DB4|nr:NUDIX domain-containing protein [Mesorhizobium sp. B1-1-8]UCI07363.1 NUDIX domain-containing protein [Mesorhizobium sp. B1-1-8]
MKTLLDLALRIRRLYWRVFQPQTFGVRAIILNSEKKVLLVRHKYGRGWYLPGGKVRRGEASLVAIERELWEELGISVASVDRALGTYVSTQEYKRDVITVYVITNFSQRHKKHFEIDANAFFAWNVLPSDASPGTKRRIQEYLGETPIASTW